MALISCPECGKQVSSEAQMCPNCGISVKEYVEEKMQLCPKCKRYVMKEENICSLCSYDIKTHWEKEIEKAAAAAKAQAEEEYRQEKERRIKAGEIEEFPLYGNFVDLELEKISVPFVQDEKVILNKKKQEMRGYTKKFINEKAQLYSENYTNETITDAKTFLKYNNDFFNKTFEELAVNWIGKLSGLLNREQMHGLNVGTIYDFYSECNFYSVAAIDEFIKQMQDANAQTYSKQMERKFRKDTRGRVVGGGFGLSGMLKGMAVAGVANAVIGAGHSAFNLAADTASVLKRDYSILKNILNKDTRDYLQDCFVRDMEYVEKMIMCFFDYLIMELEHNTSLLDYEKIQQEFNEQLKNCASEEDKKYVICKMLSVYPRHLPTYAYALRNFGDAKFELEKLAKRCNININSQKIELLEERGCGSKINRHTEEYHKYLIEEAKNLGIKTVKNTNLQEDMGRLTDLLEVYLQMEGYLDASQQCEKILKILCQEKWRYSASEQLKCYGRILRELSYSTKYQNSEWIKRIWEKKKELALDYNQSVTTYKDKLWFSKTGGLKEKIESEEKAIRKIYKETDWKSEKSIDLGVTKLRQITKYFFDIDAEIDQLKKAKQSLEMKVQNFEKSMEERIKAQEKKIEDCENNLKEERARVGAIKRNVEAKSIGYAKIFMAGFVSFAIPTVMLALWILLWIVKGITGFRLFIGLFSVVNYFLDSDFFGSILMFLTIFGIIVGGFGFIASGISSDSGEEKVDNESWDLKKLEEEMSKLKLELNELRKTKNSDKEIERVRKSIYIPSPLLIVPEKKYGIWKYTTVCAIQIQQSTSVGAIAHTVEDVSIPKDGNAIFYSKEEDRIIEAKYEMPIEKSDEICIDCQKPLGHDEEKKWNVWLMFI